MENKTTQKLFQVSIYFTRMSVSTRAPRRIRTRSDFAMLAETGEAAALKAEEVVQRQWGAYGVEVDDRSVFEVLDGVYQVGGC